MNDYKSLNAQAKSMFSDETDMICAMANAAAMIYNELDRLNWAGFYRVTEENLLVLGPFQGKVACTRIKFGKGVCGTAAQKKETQLVKNVHEFPGHIACDCASNSEIVVPMLDKSGRVYAVLDIDSPVFERFDETDKAGLEEFVSILNGIIN